ncbi:MAG: ankyrin repeat domain-containing protein [Betaproteobacteria bacterium]
MNGLWLSAAKSGDVEAARSLLDLGLDINARDRYGQTALMLAAHHGHGAVVEMLIGHGADLDVTAKYSLSALMLAVIAGHTEIARKLVRAGADRTLRGSGAPGFAGKSAYDLAAERQMEELYEELTPRPPGGHPS